MHECQDAGRSRRQSEESNQKSPLNTHDPSFYFRRRTVLEQRGATEVDVRAMLEKATAFEPSVVDGRFMIDAHHLQHPWIAIVEPHDDAKMLVVVTDSLGDVIALDRRATACRHRRPLAPSDWSIHSTLSATVCARSNYFGSAPASALRG
jgi:hypothetical protein